MYSQRFGVTFAAADGRTIKNQLIRHRDNYNTTVSRVITMVKKVS